MADPGRVPDRDIDEFDVSLLDALHRHPRASFEQLGTTLEVSSATVARRWQRLVGSGRAWVSSVPGPRLSLAAAMYEVGCVPGQVVRVGRALAALPQVASVYLTAGTFDLTTLVIAADMSSLSELLLDRLSGIDGMSRVRINVAIAWYSDAHWRLGAISGEQERSVGGDAASGGPIPGAGLRFEPADRALYLALQHDGRAGYRDLARRLGTSEQLVKRRMTVLTSQRMLRFRTDFTRTEGGWPTQLVLWLVVPDDQLAEAGAVISTWPETRICLSVLGPANLFVKLQLHRLNQVEPLFDRIRSALPAAVIADRRMVLRPMKSWGRVLDGGGRAVAVVPVDPWAEPAHQFPA